MNIVFLIAGLHEGGAERVVSVLANEMKRRQHDVKILVTWSEKCVYSLDKGIQIVPIYKKFPTEENYKNTTYYHKKKMMQCFYKCKYHCDNIRNIKLETWKNYVRYNDKAKVLANYLNENNVDIVYSFLEESNIVAALSKKYTKAKIVISERNFPGETKLSKSMLALKEYSYKKSDIVVFQTKEQKASFSKNIKKKGLVIFNPIKKDLPCFHVKERKNIIVYYGRFSEQKNIPLLIHAFDKVTKEFPEYKLELYGNGELEQEIVSLIHSLDLSKKVNIFPFSSNIHFDIVDYAMFVMTSKYEGMPNALLEAMAIGLPVISTDCLGGGARAVIQDEINGCLVPRDDVDALYTAIKRFINDQKLANKCGENARKIKENLSVEKITDYWLGLFDRR